MLRTGRMPLANPADQSERSEPSFTPEQIDALVAYVTSIAPGGEPIPAVDVSAGNLALGAQVFLNNCAGCHGAGASGDSVGGGQIAPSLYEAEPVEIGEAVRFGPGLMPNFGPETIDQEAARFPRGVPAVAARQRRRRRAAARTRRRGRRRARRGRRRPRSADPGAATHGGEAMNRSERPVAIAFAVAIVAALALFVVYVAGGNPQAEGALLAVALGGVGAGLLMWATRLMPHIGDETQPRSKTAPTTDDERATAAATVEAGVEEIRRRRFLARLLVGAAAALGLAALIPIRSLGRSPGSSLARHQVDARARGS